MEKKKAGWEAEVQEDLDVTLQSEQRGSQLSGSVHEMHGYPPPAPSSQHSSWLCQDSRAMAEPLASPWLPAVSRKEKLHQEAQGCPLAHGRRGKHCSPNCSGDVLVYNIKTSLTFTFLWTKAFTLETPSVFLPIIMITKHVIPFLLFFFFFCLHLICHQGAVFFAPLATVPLLVLAISGKHTQAHMVFTVGHPSKRGGKKKKIKKSQV